MKDLQFLLRKALWRILRINREIVNNLFRKNGIKIGTNTRINSNILTSESYLIELGNNITISDHVSFITHDNSISKALIYSGLSGGGGDLYGKIIIGDNCFIGAHSIIMYGVTLASSIIVASGAVVTKSFHEEGVIIAGNPAKVIGKVKTFAEKNSDKALKLSSLPSKTKCEILLTSDKLISR